jgi:hypothetical protein
VTSIVVDAALCLLLVSASVGTLVAAPGVDLGGASHTAATADERHAEAVAATLATTTASVNYTLAPGARHAAGGPVAFPTTEGPQFHRSSHDTLAGLLAGATVAGLSVDGRRLDHAGDDYRRAVRRRVADAVGSRVQVVAVWRPYAGASLGATFTVGPDPPTAASVRAATLTAPSGLSTAAGPPPRPPGDRTARALADRLVAGLFPPDATRLALAGDHPTTSLVRHRYHRAATLLGADLGDSVTADPATTNVTRANDLLATTLADRVATDRRTAGDPTGVTGPGSVRLTVRTWGSR